MTTKSQCFKATKYANVLWLPSPLHDYLQTIIFKTISHLWVPSTHLNVFALLALYSIDYVLPDYYKSLYILT